MDPESEKFFFAAVAASLCGLIIYLLIIHALVTQ